MMTTKSLTNYFENKRLPGEMPNPKKLHIGKGEPVSFRPPDDAFCEMFNLALDASGLDRAALCVEAIRAGLPTVVAARLDQIQKAGSEFLKRPTGLNRKK